MTTTMHFGPEWMRTKHQATARPPPPSPPPANSHAPSNASTYSALVSPAPPPEPEKRDETHPFRYSKEEMFRIYKEGGGKGGLGLEVERWEGVVREVGSDPIGIREMSDGEKKLFAGSLNSELRRRQSTDYLSPLSTQSAGGERPRLNHNNSGPASPMRERFGSLMGKRRDNSDPPPVAMPRRQSLSSSQGALASPRDGALPSPRTRMGFGPGFDGVLSGGDSWRRKATEVVSKSTGASREPANETDSKQVKISEEDEEPDIATTAIPEDKVGPNIRSTSEQFHTGIIANDTTKRPDIQTVNNEKGDASLRNASHYMSEASSGGGFVAPAPAPSPAAQSHPDLANVEWSYLDPQGNVQGPFIADVMQKWYEGGYFTPDLLMKRTHTDNDWIPVGELARRAGGGKIFLSLPLASAPPPGLSRPTEPPLSGFASPHDLNTYTTPYHQPVPTRSLRTSTLDSYLGSTSNPSDSPSSSFGGGQFGNGSPDPTAFGGRVGNNTYAADHAIGGRVSNFATSGPTFAANRATFNEPSPDSSLAVRAGVFGNAAPGQASSVDNYGFNSGYSANQAAWPSNSSESTRPSFDGRTNGLSAEPTAAFSANFDAARLGLAAGSSTYLNQSGGFGSGHGPQDVTFAQSTTGNASSSLTDYGVGAPMNPAQMVRPVGVENLGQNSGFSSEVDAPLNTAFGGQNQPSYSHSPSLQYGGASQLPISLQTSALPTPQPTSHSPQSPWATVEPAPLRRPGPFDAGHPKATNTVIKRSVTPSPPSAPWGPTSATSPHPSQTNEASPWYAASHGGPADESWRETPGPNSLTFDNVGAHNLQHEIPAGDTPLPAPETPAEKEIPSPAELSSQHVAESVSSIVPTAVQLPTTSKSKRKSVTQQNQPIATALKTQTPVLSVVKDPSPPAQSKPAWATEEDTKKTKPSGVGPGLREIQEAEAKKLETRKAAERERAARAVPLASPASEETQSFTASWGLPTSRAGARNDISPKEGPTANSSSPPVPNVPVWTNSGKPPQTKRTMKEIQEEEEKRKQIAVKETTAATAARRGYADTTNKSTMTSSMQTGGSAWTTVGATGKASAAPLGLVRPSLTPSISSLGTSGSLSSVRPNGPAAARSIAASKPVSLLRVDEPPAAPSHEFLKWLSESLKGLNSSVNFEDITSMLLSFPVDPDPSTVEIISDLIYANSTTLDGRRFASEFVSRRKADAASKRGIAVAGKPASIADVVKAQPKPPQPEWGFKVVNKKKKGGRS